MWKILHNDNQCLILQRGSWFFRILLLILPFFSLGTTIVLMFQSREVKQNLDAMPIFILMVAVIFSMTVILAWGMLISNNRKIIINKAPFWIVEERWWVFFFKKKRIPIDEFSKLQTRRVERRITIYYLYVTSKYSQNELLAEPSFKNFSELLQLILNYSQLELDQGSEIIATSRPGLFQVEKKNIGSDIKRFIFFFILTIIFYYLKKQK